MHKNWPQILGLSLAMGLVVPRDAFAYLDPGSGSMVFQALAAGFAAAAYGIRLYWSRIRAFFGRRESTSSEDGPQMPSR